MGSKFIKLSICSVCGAALVGHFEHEAHEHKESIKRPFTRDRQVMIDSRLPGRHHHNNEPEQPSGPIQETQATVVSTSTAALSLSPLLFGSSGSGGPLPLGLVWNPQSGVLILGGTTDPRSGSNLSTAPVCASATNPRSGSNVSASSGFTTAAFPGGIPRSS